MRQLFLTLLMAFACATTWAQEQTEGAAAPADSVAAQATSTEHILFEGIEVKGDIYEFAAVMQKRGFTLSKRLGNEKAYIFKGTVCGQSCYVQASYTKHTRTVYRLMVQPKHVDLNSYLDSLNVRYGQVFDETERGYQWMLPNGAVMFITPEGYDPTLVVMDAIGVAAYKDEENR
ncbi:MAG: hypothetical protein IJJ94_02640 [Bacteroidaceae bacterium]|nr:hypothetical protein [Bacteroidaceae bacterium]